MMLLKEGDFMAGGTFDQKELGDEILVGELVRKLPGGDPMGLSYRGIRDNGLGSRILSGLCPFPFSRFRGIHIAVLLRNGAAHKGDEAADA
jgi:hypothetical protein